MTLSGRIARDDTILPFQFDRSGIRGRIARLDGVPDEILSRHDHPPARGVILQHMPEASAGAKGARKPVDPFGQGHRPYDRARRRRHRRLSVLRRALRDGPGGDGIRSGSGGA